MRGAQTARSALLAKTTKRVFPQTVRPDVSVGLQRDRRCIMRGIRAALGIFSAYEFVSIKLYLLRYNIFMKSLGCRKAGIRLTAAYQKFPALCRYAFVSAFILAMVAAQAALCDEHGKHEGAAVRGEDDRAIINPHDALGARPFCSVCHTAKPPELSFDAVTTCVKCHAGNIDNHPISRHPIGGVPRIRVPSFLPLTADGRMVCYTCHDPHKKLTDERQDMLRVDYQTLCSACHVGY